MRRSPPERVDAPLRWLRANKHDLGPLTGQDTRALLAIAAAWRLYCNSDDHGQPATLRAIDELLHCMQPQCWRFARAVIPWAADWSHERQWWDCLVVVNPTIGLVNVDHIHPRGHRCPAEEVGFAGPSRDFLQCRANSDDGSPCRRNVDGLSGEFCVEHAAAAEAKTVQS
jgi:hypothetical protein